MGPTTIAESEVQEDRAFRRASVEVELDTLRRLATEVLCRLDIEETLMAILNSASELVDADIAGILLADEDGVRMRACTGNKTLATARLFVGTNDGVAGRVYSRRRSLKVDDYEDDGQWISSELVDIARAEGKRSGLGAPMILRDDAIGTLMVWRRRPSVFTDEDARILSALGSLAAIAISNAELYETERTAVARLEQANALLEKQNDLLRTSADLHDELTRAVLGGRGLGEVTTIVAEHVDGEALVLDRELNVLASSISDEAIAARATAHLEMIGPATSPPPTTVVPPDSSSPRWLIVTGLVAGGEHLGYLCLSFPRPPQEFEPVFAEQAAIVCALHLTKEQAVLDARARLHSDLLWDLLDGTVSDDTEAVLRATRLGHSPPSQLRVVLVELDAPPAGERTTDDIATIDRRRAVLTRSAERAVRDSGLETTLSARRGLRIGLLVAEPQRPEQTRLLGRAIITALRRAAPELVVAVGVSGPTAFKADLSGPCRQAEAALSAAACSPDAFATFDDLGVVRFLLAPGERIELTGFVQSVLGPVQEYDATHANSALVETIDAYLGADCNLERAAEKLYVHAKTVRYRLDRAEELTGIDFSSQEDRFNAQLALKILHALSLE